MKKIAYLIALTLTLLISCNPPGAENVQYKLWYNEPASNWREALPIGNGSLGAMVFGGVETEHIQFNESTLWTGEPRDYSHPDAFKFLSEIRQLLFEGKQWEAESLAMKEFMSLPLGQMDYQPFGDLYLEFPGHENFSKYHRELNISEAVNTTSYLVYGVNYKREVFASYPQRAIAVHLTADKSKSLSFTLKIDAEHSQKSISTDQNSVNLAVQVKDGALHGYSSARVRTNGKISQKGDHLEISQASEATIWLAAATNYVSYDDISKDPEKEVNQTLDKLENMSFKEVKKTHIDDYRSLFDRFSIQFGKIKNDTIPTNERLLQFSKDAEDTGLLALHVQFGRYLLISSSRPGTHPATLQGIWNDQLYPPWGSKYTLNINAEMNYWPAEVTNLPECHQALFDLIKDCSETGAKVAKEHYACDGWVIHHNTDLWRGAAPINHSNHGLWVGGSGWLCNHLWEHYLYTFDENFLRNTAYPIIKPAAIFYSQFLIKDPKTGWLISTPSNSPEGGGLVAGPAMDHQIIRTLFDSFIKASDILGEDKEIAKVLKSQLSEIAPNQVGKYGQLQEWLEDIDDPNYKHRHISHLWGMCPGNDFNWDSDPALMEAAKQSLLFRGDEGTGWSLAWKINVWARLLNGDHAYGLVKMMLRPVESTNVNISYDEGGGGTYPNFFCANPPFQIDGNFGTPAGVLEMIVQSHTGFIDVLPALPKSLPEGEVSGLCARGGFELALSWKNHVLENLEINSKAGEKCKLRYKGQVYEFETEAGKSYTFNAELEKI